MALVLRKVTFMRVVLPYTDPVLMRVKNVVSIIGPEGPGDETRG